MQIVVLGASLVGGVGAGLLACAFATHATGQEVPAGWRRCACLALAAAWLALTAAWGPRLEVLELALTSVALTTLTLTDLQCLLIPNACVLATVVLHACALVAAALSHSQPLATAAAGSVLSALCVGVPLVALTLIMDRVLGYDSMGGGDLKLLAAAGFCLGFLPALAVVVVACVLGLAMAAGGAAGERSRTFAFGPAIALSWALVGGCLPALQSWTNAGML